MATTGRFFGYHRCRVFLRDVNLVKHDLAGMYVVKAVSKITAVVY